HPNTRLMQHVLDPANRHIKAFADLATSQTGLIQLNDLVLWDGMLQRIRTTSASNLQSCLLQMAFDHATMSVEHLAEFLLRLTFDDVQLVPVGINHTLVICHSSSFRREVYYVHIRVSIRKFRLRSRNRSSSF